MTKLADKPQWVRSAEQFEQSGLTQKQLAQQQGLPLETILKKRGVTIAAVTRTRSRLLMRAS